MSEHNLDKLQELGYLWPEVGVFSVKLLSDRAFVFGSSFILKLKQTALEKEIGSERMKQSISFKSMKVQQIEEPDLLNRTQ